MDFFHIEEHHYASKRSHSGFNTCSLCLGFEVLKLHALLLELNRGPPEIQTEVIAPPWGLEEANWLVPASQPRQRTHPHCQIDKRRRRENGTKRRARAHGRVAHLAGGGSCKPGPGGARSAVWPAGGGSSTCPANLRASAGPFVYKKA
jgi:hypothetical protein